MLAKAVKVTCRRRERRFPETPCEIKFFENELKSKTVDLEEATLKFELSKNKDTEENLNVIDPIQIQEEIIKEKTEEQIKMSELFEKSCKKDIKPEIKVIPEPPKEERKRGMHPNGAMIL